LLPGMAVVARWTSGASIPPRCVPLRYQASPLIPKGGLDPRPTQRRVTLRSAPPGSVRCGVSEVVVVAAPYRACPLGAHIDHQLGPVTAVALNLGVCLAFLPTPHTAKVRDSARRAPGVTWRVPARVLAPPHCTAETAFRPSPASAAGCFALAPCPFALRAPGGGEVAG